MPQDEVLPGINVVNRPGRIHHGKVDTRPNRQKTRLQTPFCGCTPGRLNQQQTVRPEQLAEFHQLIVLGRQALLGEDALEGFPFDEFDVGNLGERGNENCGGICMGVGEWDDCNPRSGGGQDGCDQEDQRQQTAIRSS